MSTSEYMSDRPKISVLIPIYNAERYLAKTLESVLKQTFTNFEVIAINDGSTDGSEAILHEFQQRDRRIYVFSQQNAGLIETLNRGLTALCLTIRHRLGTQQALSVGISDVLCV